MSSSAERLAQIYPFDPVILERVGEVADRQSGLSFEEFLTQNQMPGVQIYPPKHGKAIEVFDRIPVGGYDETWVYHEAMATGLDRNTLMHVGTLALAAPDKRIIAVGNPGRPGHGYGKARFLDLPKVWSGNLNPLVGPVFQYLASQGIESATHIGFSLGADLVAASGEHVDKYDQEVVKAIMMDPASVVIRGMIKLAIAYNETEKHLDHYIEATGSKPYLEARKLSGGLPSYVLALLRPNNIALSHMLGQDGFEGRADRALMAQPDMNAHVVWGSLDELALDGEMLKIQTQLQIAHGTDRVAGTRLEGQWHAMCDDIYLHTATILHAAA